MFGRFMPREGNFFELFAKSGEQILKGAQEFRAMLDDMQNADSRARHIKAIEHDADEITHRTIDLLHKTFITPLDREDIHKLISQMDDIVDFIEAASQRLSLYGIKEATPAAKQLADVCTRAAECIQRSVAHLDDLSNPQKLIHECVEINRLENDADHILREAVAKLFAEEQDIRQLIKWKEIYELLETVTDRCEDVANTIEGIVLEYA